MKYEDVNYDADKVGFAVGEKFHRASDRDVYVLDFSFRKAIIEDLLAYSTGGGGHRNAAGFEVGIDVLQGWLSGRA